jgi:hypothetical protein
MFAANPFMVLAEHDLLRPFKVQEQFTAEREEGEIRIRMVNNNGIVIISGVTIFVALVVYIATLALLDFKARPISWVVFLALIALSTTVIVKNISPEEIWTLKADGTCEVRAVSVCDVKTRVVRGVKKAKVLVSPAGDGDRIMWTEKESMSNHACLSRLMTTGPDASRSILPPLNLMPVIIGRCTAFRVMLRARTSWRARR